MMAVKFNATSSFRPGLWSAIEAKILPAVAAAVEEGAGAVRDFARDIVPVDTGRLLMSIRPEVEIVGQRVTGYVVAGMEYAAYVEFGTGARGAGSAGAGPFNYRMDWPGMSAQPYLRPALDMARPNVLDAFRSRGFQVA